MLRMIAEAILLPAGAIVSQFVSQANVGFPIYQLVVALLAMAVFAALLLYGSQARRDPHR